MTQKKSDTTIVITSCGRHDLLARTLQSLVLYNTDKQCSRIIVVEDGGDDPTSICHKFGAEVIRPGHRIGQPASIDLAYQHVTTPYIFHCEDDWEFYRPGFIEKSRAILNVDQSSGVVWLRAWADTNGHPLSFRSRSRTFGVMDIGYMEVWHGFTWNPGLRRLDDYIEMGPFAPLAHEQGANARFREVGLRAVILDEIGYVRHIGEGRHVNFSDTGV